MTDEALSGASATKGKWPSAMAAFHRHDDALILRIMADTQRVEIALQPSDVLESLSALFPEYGLEWAIPQVGAMSIGTQAERPHLQRESGLRPREKAATLSVSMIVRDEEEFLARCLDSIREVADEIVIVDTGSIDETVKIAKCYTDKVYFHPWKDSFSEARNHSLSYCTCDWVLQIDADEELLREDIPMLREGLKRLANKPEIDAVMITILSEVRGGNVSRSFFPRLFRRGLCHYEGIVHNQLVRSGGRIGKLAVRIIHHGYNLSEAEMRKKVTRTERLLRKQLEADPTNAFAWTNLIHSHRNQHKPEFVIANAFRVLDNPRASASNRHTTRGDLMVAYLESGEPEKGIPIAQQAMIEQPENADNLWLLAWLHKENGQTIEAIGDLERFLEMKALEQRNGVRVDATFCDTIGKEPVAIALLAQWREEMQPVKEGA